MEVAASVNYLISPERGSAEEQLDTPVKPVMHCNGERWYFNCGSGRRILCLFPLPVSRSRHFTSRKCVGMALRRGARAGCSDMVAAQDGN
jgi:hypothetical protein